MFKRRSRGENRQVRVMQEMFKGDKTLLGKGRYT